MTNHAPKRKMQRIGIVLSAYIVAFVLAICVHYQKLENSNYTFWNSLGSSVFYFYDLIKAGQESPKLESSLTDWYKFWTTGSDVYWYTHVAEAFASGHGMSEFCRPPKCPQEQYIPWSFWAPGTPWIYSWPIKLSQTLSTLPPMTSIFIFVLIMDFLGGIFSILTVYQFTQRLAPLTLAAVLSGYGFSLQAHYYSWLLPSAESALALLGPLFFFLISCCFKLYNENARLKELALNFFGTGFIFGIIAIIRESMFTFVFMIIPTLFLLATLSKNKKKFVHAAVASMAIYAAMMIPRQMIVKWNTDRMNLPYVAQGTTGIWKDNLWAEWLGPKKDSDRKSEDLWYIHSGIGMASYFEPEIGKQVRSEFAQGTMTTSKAIGTFIQVILKHPIEVIWFKIQRLPRLLLDTESMPFVEMKALGYWNLIQISMLIGFVVWCLRNRFYIPEMTYLYLVFILGSFLLIHAEYRYTIPAWMGLRLVPALFLGYYLEASDRLRAKNRN